MKDGARPPGAASLTGTGRGRMPGAAKAVTALAPVRAHLMREARAEADHIRAAARAEAEELLRQARLGVQRAVRDGAARGQPEAAPLAATAANRTLEERLQAARSRQPLPRQAHRRPRSTANRRSPQLT